MSTAPRNKDRDRDRDRELSEILQEAQLLRAEVVQRALADAKKLGEPLWRLLLREGLLTDDQLFRVLKQYVRVPVLAEEHLDNVVVPPELREALKPRLAQLLGVLPLERSTDGRRAALAMIDPTIDIAPVWPALSQLGVVEVRRFLLNLPTLRRGMQMFYGQSYESQAVDANLDGPTPPPSRSAITQPIPRPVPEAPSVMVDPGLQAEIEQLSGSIPVPSLTEDSTGPRDSPPAGRPVVPSALGTTMPSVRGGSSSDAIAPARSASSGPAVQPTPAALGSGSNPAIPIEIDLPDVIQLNSGEVVPITSMRELSGFNRPLMSGVGSALNTRSPLGPGRAGPVMTPAPVSPAASAENGRPVPLARRSPTAPPLPPSVAGSAAPTESTRTTSPLGRRPTTVPPLPQAPPVSAPSTESARTTAPPSRPGTTIPPLTPATAGSAPSTESARTTAPPARRSPTAPPLPQASPSAASVPRPGLGAAAPASPLGRAPAPAAADRSGQTKLAPSAQSPLQELNSADMVLDEERGGLTANRRALRVPAAQSEAPPAVALDVTQDALISTCEALVATVESQLRTTWPTALALLCQGVGDQLGFAPRAVRELMLVARLRGVVRAELLARGPLPPPRPTLLGYPTSSPLLGAARELQKVLVDFMRLPQDEDEPLGMRIVATAAQALELRDKGLGDEELVAKLRAQWGDTDVVFQVNKALALNPPQVDVAPTETAPAAAPTSAASTLPAPASAASTPPAPASAAPQPTRAPALWPLPPRMPTVSWTTVQVAELSDAGLVPYQPDEA